MKSIALALASILATTVAAWAAPASVPIKLTYVQLADAVQRADRDPHTLRGFAGSHLTLDLRPGVHPYFVAAEDRRGIAFICQSGFEGFEGGPVTATLVKYERGEDARDYVKLDACNPLER